MKEEKLLCLANAVRLILGLAVVASLTSCVAYTDRPLQGSTYVEPYSTFAPEDDYVYYPEYECYYSASRHQYAYREGNAWVGRPAPRAVSVNVLQASPSVKMDFHDSPANHHAAVAQQYPRNWKPSGGDSGRDQGHSEAPPAGHQGEGSPAGHQDRPNGGDHGH